MTFMLESGAPAPAATLPGIDPAALTGLLNVQTQILDNLKNSLAVQGDIDASVKAFTGSMFPNFANAMVASIDRVGVKIPSPADWLAGLSGMRMMVNLDGRELWGSVVQFAEDNGLVVPQS